VFLPVSMAASSPAGCAQRRLNAGHYVRGSHLLRFCEEVVRIAIRNHPTELVKDVARGNQRGTALEKFSHSYQKQSCLTLGRVSAG
jgi:hypothetical protein